MIASNPALDQAHEIVRKARIKVKERFLYYKPHDKQMAFHAAGATAKERLFLAGNRTGKTYSGCIEVAMHLTGNYPDWWQGYRYNHPIEAWAAGVTNAETYQVLEKAYIGDVGVAGAIAPHLITGTEKIKHLYKIQHKSGGTSQLRFKSYEQGRKTFQGAKIHVLHMDEEPPRDIYIEGLMRTMATDDKHYGMVLLTMTPLMGLTAMVQQFYEPLTEGCVSNNKFYIQASWQDNPHLIEEEKKTILASLKPHEIEAREKGIPSIGMGLVYPVPESLVTCDPLEKLPDHWSFVYGIDFGWNPSPTALLFAAYDRDNDILYIYDEYTATERTPAEHVYALSKRGFNLNEIMGVYDPAGKISGQNDGKNLVQLYRDQGIHTLTKADNSKETGIQKVLQRMQSGNLKIYNTCTRTLRELRMYARDEEGNVKKGNDHLMDCLRYIVMSGLKVAQPKLKPQTYADPPNIDPWCY